MNTYIALLRGINVSGKNKIKMAELKVSLQKLSLEKVTTYIQSGNIVFQSESTSLTELQALISECILKDFGLTVPTLVLESNELEQIIANNPYLKNESVDPAKVYYTFLEAAPAPGLFETIDIDAYLPEEFILSDRTIYFHCPTGYGKTKLNNNFFEKKLKVRATTRNVKTSNKLLEMASGLG
ncbi:DUF1697 domain-containing protein [Flammeovirgaceae bacterium SG7u.111]|nr:DUF1697 domain-containing protein [Flammeovirgaceae bacterium SG7u.132]WPO33072.1 DUF1697 domain-containing protein [Flammeovirgaceae bacterium SG7u.111]